MALAALARAAGDSSRPPLALGDIEGLCRCLPDEGLRVLSHRTTAALVCEGDDGLRVLSQQGAAARAHGGLRSDLLDLAALAKASWDSSGLQTALDGMEELGRCLPS